MKKIFLFSILLLTIFSCSKENDVLDDDDDNSTNTETNENDTNDSFETNSKDTIFTNAVQIVYANSGINVTNPYENQGVSVSVTGGDVIVTSTISNTEINYVLSGTHNDGSFKIYSSYKFGLGLNGVSLIHSDGPAINIQSEKKTSIYLVGETNNRLIDNNTYATSEEDMKGALFSEGQLVFNGAGNLILKGYYKHAIASDDYVQINGGNITIQSAYKDGIHANDSFVMEGGTLTINASGDGIECEEGPIELNGGSITINSTDDGIVSSYEGNDSDISSSITIGNVKMEITTAGEKGMGVKTETGSIIIAGGTTQIKTTGVAAKAFKAGGNMNISGGETMLTTTGDGMYDQTENDISSAAGIKCGKDLTIDRGALTINSSGAGGKGISIDGNLIINGGDIGVTTTGAQYRSGNNDTAAKAIKSDGNVTINGGNITIKTSGTEAEGLESKKTLTINSGTIEVEAYDDCINASTHISLNGGNIYCYSTTNDGIDSNGTLTITGGTIVSSGTTSPEEGFDCDNHTFIISGGTVIGVGGATSTPSSSASTQRSVVYGGSGSANQLIHIESSNGDPILTYKIPRAYNQMTLLFSSSSLAANTSYTIYTGGSISGGSEFHGFYSGASYTKGTAAQTFSSSSMVTTVGSTSTGGGGGRP